MDFIDHLKQLSQKIERSQADVITEEATKAAFVMPFIHALGYDVFNPLEVIPEFTADHGIKKGEKVDFAIKKDGSIAMLIECKCCDARLDTRHASQLYRYFTVTDAKIGILTNGIVYQVFTDLDKPNTMDERPFLEFDLLNLNEALVPEIKRLAKLQFNIDETMNAAVALKYTQGIRRVIEQEFSEPSDDLIRLLAKNVYSGKRMGAQQIEEFSPIVKRAIQQYVSDRISSRITAALQDNEEERPETHEDPVSIEETGKPAVETTTEEQEAYAIVKAIVRRVIDPERIASRDTLSYFGVLLDDNNRKPICRLHFNRSQKYLGLFDQEKNEDRVAIATIDDIYDYADRLCETIQFYEGEEIADEGEATSGDAPAVEGSDDVPVQSIESVSENGAGTET